MKTIRLAWKALARFRTYTFINILGLALSLACVLIILRYIHQEVTVNHFCKDLVLHNSQNIVDTLYIPTLQY